MLAKNAKKQQHAVDNAIPDKKEWFMTKWILILLMSSQIDAPLQLPSSYNFGKGTVNLNRRNTIDPNNFQLWLRHDMYASTYAKHHSPVKYA